MTPAAPNNDGISAGTFTTDRDLVVTSWDDWIAAATGIDARDARGQAIATLYPELESRGILARMQRVLRQGTFEILAPAFHKYLLPVPPRQPSAHFERMRQYVTISPIRNGTEVTGVAITIEDVTPRLERERALLLQLRAEDEEARLQAAEALAASGNASGILTEAITDPSWRVRRVTAAGLAASGGPQTTGALIEALREHHSDPSILSATLTAIATSRDDLVAQMASVLTSPDDDLRTYAALALGLIGDSRAVPDLLDALSDGNVNVRYHAIEALGRIGDRSAAEALVGIAETRDFFLAFAAIDALTAIGEPSVASRLLPLLDDPMLVGPAATCLGAIGTEDVAASIAALLDRPGQPITDIVAALASLHARVQGATGEGVIVADIARTAITPRAAGALMDALANATTDEREPLITVLGWLRYDHVDDRLAGLLADPQARTHVATVLATHGTRAVPVLVAAASELDAEGQKLVAMALGQIGSADGVPFLCSLLAGDTPVVIAAAGALGAIGDRGAYEPLMASLDHPVEAVRRAAVGALNSIGHPEMESAVRRLLAQPSSRLRESAARIAGYFGYDGALEAMLQLARDGDEGVRRAVVEHLVNFDDPRAAAATLDALTQDRAATVRAAAARALAQSDDDDSLRALVKACDDPDLWVRYYAIRALARRTRDDAFVVTALRRLARDDAAPPVRIAAIEGMAAIPAPVFVPVLKSKSTDTEPEVADAALRAMGAFSADDTRDVLVRELSSSDRARQLAALAAVAQQRDEQWVPFLRFLAESGDAATKRACVVALRDIGSTRAVAALVQLAESMQLRPLVLQALGTLDASQVEFLGDALAYENEGIRCMVVESLGRMKHPAVVKLLVAALDDPSSAVRLAATQALARLDLRSAKGQLAQMSRTDESPAVRHAARDAVARD